MKFNTKLLAIFALVAVIAVAGCAGAPQEGIGNGAEEQQAPPAEPEPPALPEETAGCVDDLDCADVDDCTTDSCVEGICVNDVESGCQQKLTGEPYISEVSFTGDEYVKVDAQNWDVAGWTIEDAEGNVFFTFPERFTLNNFVKVYSASGISTATNKYADTGEFWDDIGDKAFLVDDLGNTVSELAG